MVRLGCNVWDVLTAKGHVRCLEGEGTCLEE